MAEADSRRRHEEDSGWDTSKRKEEGLTSGPGRSAGEGRPAGQQHAAGLAKLGPCGAQGRKTELGWRRGKKGQRPTGPVEGRSRVGQKQGKEKKKEIYFFSIFPKQIQKYNFQLNSKSDFKPSNTKHYATT